MLAETTSSADDVASEANEVDTDSYHGKQKVGEAVQRLVTMEMGEMTPIRAAILDGRVGARRTTADDGRTDGSDGWTGRADGTDGRTVGRDGTD